MKVAGNAPHDAIVVGGGLVGLTATAALANAGRRVLLLMVADPGAASLAAAGMLSPSVEAGDGPAHEFALAARDRYPAYLDWVAERTGKRIPLSRDGILEVATTSAEADRLQHADGRRARTAGDRSGATEWVGATGLRHLEPALAPAAGALFHPVDGWVDSRALYYAIRDLVSADSRVDCRAERAILVEPGERESLVQTDKGSRFEASVVVLAPGAWIRTIQGVPTSLPVEPVRGQMLALDATPLHHVCFGAGGYVVPRTDGRTFVGSTMERVGFDPSMTEAAQRDLEQLAARLCPGLGTARVAERWAGLRPVTPDMQPTIGHDPHFPSIIYAVGHSRNGVLLAPITSDCVVALATGSALPLDLSPFSPTRFHGASGG